MILLHRNLLITLFTIVLIVLANPVFAGEKGSFAVLSTKHKHSPYPKIASEKMSGNNIVRLSSYGEAKRRPETKNSNLSKHTLRNKISSKSALLVDSRTGEILYSRAPDRPGQPASTIKVLTALIAMKYLKDNEFVYVSPKAARMPSSKVYLEQGKSYRAGDLIDAVLLSSANDASVALAEKIAGSEEAFAKLMTHKAQVLGAKNTVCKNATGLTARGQKSTARDLARIFKAAMANNEFSERVARIKVRTSYGKTLKNHNRALWQLDGALGGKTGYTRAARQTYVGKFSKDGQDLIVAVMGSETMWDDIDNLVNYGYSINNKREIKRKEELLAKNSSRDESANEQHALLVLSDNKKISNWLN